MTNRFSSVENTTEFFVMSHTFFAYSKDRKFIFPKFVVTKNNQQ